MEDSVGPYMLKATDWVKNQHQLQIKWFTHKFDKDTVMPSKEWKMKYETSVYVKDM